jgi:hypothetical protein
VLFEFYNKSSATSILSQNGKYRTSHDAMQSENDDYDENGADVML